MVLSRSGQLKSIWLSRILLAQGTCIPRIFPAYKKPERELPQSKKSGTQVIGMKGQNLVRLAKKRSQLILDCSFSINNLKREGGGRAAACASASRTDPAARVVNGRTKILIVICCE
jgi:hypothetical protein